MRSEPYETYKVGDVTVEIYPDDHAESPGDSYDESMMLVGWARDFKHEVARYDSLSDFHDFIHPHNLNEWDYPNVVKAAEPLVEPERYDERWVAVYYEAAGELEQIAGMSGEEVSYSNPDAFQSAEADLEGRNEVWSMWETYRQAHKEFACITVRVHNYGGGHMRLSLGEVWDGDMEDAYGRQREPEAMIRLRRSDFLNATPVDVAQSMVDQWNQWFDGDIWGYVLRREDTDEELDSCWGYYGIEDCKEQASDSAKWHDDHMVKQMRLPFTQGQEAAHG